MAGGLPVGWEWDYDGSRWFYKYKPTGHVQFHFPSEGDEFPDFVDAATPAPVLAPEERLESQQQVKRQTSTTGAGYHGGLGGGGNNSRHVLPVRDGKSNASKGREKDAGKPQMSATARPVSAMWEADVGYNEDEDDTDGVFQPENFMFLGPGTYTDVSPLAEEEEEAARRIVAGPIGQKGRPTEAGNIKTVSPLASGGTTPLPTKSEPVPSPLQRTDVMELASGAEASPPTAEPVLAQAALAQTSVDGEETAHMLDSRAMPHELPAEANPPQLFDPVGFVAEMATEHTPVAHIERHPDPVEIGDNSVLAPVETAVPPGIAELSGESNDVGKDERKQADEGGPNEQRERRGDGESREAGELVPQPLKPLRPLKVAHSPPLQVEAPRETGEPSPQPLKPSETQHHPPLQRRDGEYRLADNEIQHPPKPQETQKPEPPQQTFKVKRKPPGEGGSQQDSYQPYSPSKAAPEPSSLASASSKQHNHRGSVHREDYSLMLGNAASGSGGHVSSFLSAPSPPQGPPSRTPLGDTTAKTTAPTPSQNKGQLAPVAPREGGGGSGLDHFPSVLKPARNANRHSIQGLPVPLPPVEMKTSPGSQAEAGLSKVPSVLNPTRGRYSVQNISPSPAPQVAQKTSPPPTQPVQQETASHPTSMTPAPQAQWAQSLAVGNQAPDAYRPLAQQWTAPTTQQGTQQSLQSVPSSSAQQEKQQNTHQTSVTPAPQAGWTQPPVGGNQTPAPYGLPAQQWTGAASQQPLQQTIQNMPIAPMQEEKKQVAHPASATPAAQAGWTQPPPGENQTPAPYRPPPQQWPGPTTQRPVKQNETTDEPPQPGIRRRSTFDAAEVSPIRARSESQSSVFPLQTPSPMETLRRTSINAAQSGGNGGSTYTPSQLGISVEQSSSQDASDAPPVPNKTTQGKDAASYFPTEAAVELDSNKRHSMPVQIIKAWQQQQQVQAIPPSEASVPAAGHFLGRIEEREEHDGAVKGQPTPPNSRPVPAALNLQQAQVSQQVPQQLPAIHPQPLQQTPNFSPVNQQQQYQWQPPTPQMPPGQYPLQQPMRPAPGGMGIPPYVPPQGQIQQQQPMPAQFVHPQQGPIPSHGQMPPGPMPQGPPPPGHPHQSFTRQGFAPQGPIPQGPVSAQGFGPPGQPFVQQPIWNTQMAPPMAQNVTPGLTLGSAPPPSQKPAVKEKDKENKWTKWFKSSKPQSPTPQQQFTQPPPGQTPGLGASFQPPPGQYWQQQQQKQQQQQIPHNVNASSPGFQQPGISQQFPPTQQMETQFHNHQQIQMQGSTPALQRRSTIDSVSAYTVSSRSESMRSPTPGQMTRSPTQVHRQPGSPSAHSVEQYQQNTSQIMPALQSTPQGQHHGHSHSTSNIQPLAQQTSAYNGSNPNDKGNPEATDGQNKWKINPVADYSGEDWGTEEYWVRK